MVNQWFLFFKLGKIFVARLSETITADDLKEHFEKFGPVTDVYIPKPFRSFAFVTFQESKIAQSLFGKDHLIKGVSVHIGSAQPRMKQGHDQHGGGGGGGGKYIIFSSNRNFHSRFNDFHKFPFFRQIALFNSRFNDFQKCSCFFRQPAMSNSWFNDFHNFFSFLS